MKIIPRLRSRVANVFSTNKKGFTLDGDRSQMVRTTLTRKSGDIDYTVDEAVLGNKRHVIITKRNFTESPVITTMSRKEKGFENGKLVYTDTSVYYDTQLYTDHFLDSLGNTHYGR